MKQIITIGTVFLAIFILTGCTSKEVKNNKLETNVYKHTDEKPFTIADVDALTLKEETTSKEEVTTAEEPIVIMTPNTESDLNTTQAVEEEIAIVEEPAIVSTPEPEVEQEKPLEVATKDYYIQVSSFLKYPPSKKFLASITTLGYTYKFHKVTENSTTTTKVLVGPFINAREARDAGKIIRDELEPGAFLVKR
jgi:cell division septation protein DedD